MSKKVTIMIPVYNGSNYLKEAIESALAQTYKNKEVVVVNDGSTDDGKTAAIAKSFGNKIKYYEKENGGVSTALNLGIKKATGDYICWLSHDDLYYPNKVERQMEEIEKYDENTILFSDFDLIDENGVKFNEIHYNHEVLMEKPDYAVLRGMIGGITLLIPKHAFEKTGEFKVELRCTQDYDMWFRMLENYKFIHMPENLTMTRIHRNQDTNTSPRVITEGNPLWINISKDYPLEKKIALEGSEYLFYKEMETYLKTTPYEDAVLEIKSLAEKCLEDLTKNVNNKTVTVIITTNENEEDLNNTIQSVKEQNFKNIEIIVIGKTKDKKVVSVNNKKEAIEKATTDYHTFISAGAIAKPNWIEEQLLNALATSKGIIISDLDRPNKDSVSNNPQTLFTTIDGIFITSNKIEYKDDYQYLYDIYKKLGSLTTDEKYFISLPRNYNMVAMYDLFAQLISDNKLNDYQKAAISYDLTCIYNKTTKSDKPVYMYERCNELRNLMFSRSFRLLVKYMDYKRKRKEAKKQKKLK